MRLQHSPNGSSAFHVMMLRLHLLLDLFSGEDLTVLVKELIDCILQVGLGLFLELSAALPIIDH